MDGPRDLPRTQIYLRDFLRGRPLTKLFLRGFVVFVAGRLRDELSDRNIVALLLALPVDLQSGGGEPRWRLLLRPPRSFEEMFDDGTLSDD